MYQVILLVYSGSPRSDAALRHAKQLATAFNASVHVLGVTVPVSGIFFALSNGMLEAMEPLHSRTDVAVKVAAASLRGQGIKVHERVAEGDLEYEVFKFASKIGADIVVLDQLDREVLFRLIRGFESALPKNAVPCSVFVVEPWRHSRARSQPDWFSSVGAGLRRCLCFPK